MTTSTSIGGHPVHPILIPFPIALWIFSLVSDGIYLWRGNPAWEWVAFYTLAGGIVGAVLAAIFGIIDYFSILDRKVSSIAAWHARINVLTLLIFAASFYLRTTGGSRMVSGSLTIPVALSVVGVLLLSVSGWLGGELVFKHGVGVRTEPDAGAK